MARRFFALTRLLLARLRPAAAPLAALLACGCLLGAGLGLAAERSVSAAAPQVQIVLSARAEADASLADALAEYLGGMEDIARYCTFRSASPQEAERLLSRGEVSAVLWLPEGFIGSILSGENRAPGVETPAGRPLEAALVRWLAASAADMLTTAQAGIYAVLNWYDSLPAPPIDRDRAVLEINMRYLQYVFSRDGLFAEESLSAAGQLNLGDHYTLGSLLCLFLFLSPLLSPAFGGADLLRFRRRAGALGIGPGLTAAAGLLGASAITFPLLWAALSAVTGELLPCLLPALLGAALAAGLAGACTWRGGDGTLPIFLAVFLFALTAGCLLPPAMLPGWLRALGSFSPLSHLRALAAAALGYAAPSPLPLAGMVLLLWGITFLRRRKEAAV